MRRALVCGSRGDDARRAAGRAAHRRRASQRRRPARQAKIDAAEAAEAVERRLRARDVHHREALRLPRAQRRRRRAAARRRGRTCTCTSSPFARAERARRRRREEDRVGRSVSRRSPIAGHQRQARRRRRETRRCRRCAASRRGRRASRRPRRPGSRQRHAAPSREHRDRAPRRSRSAVRAPRDRPLAGQRLHALRELVHAACVDELHRVAERDAERDREHGERDPQPVLRERAAQHRAGGRTPSATVARVVTSGRRDCARSPSRVSTSTRSAVAAATRECVTRMPAACRALTWSRSSASTCAQCPDRDCRSARPRARARDRGRAHARSRRAAVRRPTARAACSHARSRKTDRREQRLDPLRRGGRRSMPASDSGSATFCASGQIRQHVERLEDEAHPGRAAAPSAHRRRASRARRRRRRSSPRSGRSSPAMRLSSVDLPTPDSPITAT